MNNLRLSNNLNKKQFVHSHSTVFGVEFAYYCNRLQSLVCPKHFFIWGDAHRTVSLLLDCASIWIFVNGTVWPHCLTYPVLFFSLLRSEHGVPPPVSPWPRRSRCSSKKSWAPCKTKLSGLLRYWYARSLPNTVYHMSGSPFPVGTMYAFIKLIADRLYT